MSQRWASTLGGPIVEPAAPDPWPSGASCPPRRPLRRTVHVPPSFKGSSGRGAYQGDGGVLAAVPAAAEAVARG